MFWLARVSVCKLKEPFDLHSIVRCMMYICLDTVPAMLGGLFFTFPAVQKITVLLMYELSGTDAAAIHILLLLDRTVHARLVGISQGRPRKTPTLTNRCPSLVDIHAGRL